MAVKKFEDALARLEVIVTELEQGELSMDHSLKIFEEGVRLSKQCMKMLEDAEKKVEVLLQDTDGALRSEPFLVESDEQTHDLSIGENTPQPFDENK